MPKTILLTVAGIALLLSGIVLALREWESILIVYKGFVGPTLAVIGLFLLFLVSGKSGKT